MGILFCLNCIFSFLATKQRVLEEMWERSQNQMWLERSQAGCALLQNQKTQNTRKTLPTMLGFATQTSPPQPPYRHHCCLLTKLIFLLLKTSSFCLILCYPYLFDLILCSVCLGLGAWWMRCDAGPTHCDISRWINKKFHNFCNK